MKIKITSGNIEVTDVLKNQIEEKLGKLNKYEIVREDTPCNVLIRSVREEQVVGILVHLENKKPICVEKRASDLFTAIDLAEATLSRQIRKEKEKTIERKRTAGRNNEIETIQQEMRTKVKEKSIPLMHMTVEEAIDQMETMECNFYLFLNSDTGNVNVVYKRDKSDYGLLNATA